MLEITAENVKLDLPEDIQLTMIIENPFMINDRIPTPYSLSFDLPPTRTNLKVTKWPNRVTSYQQVVELACEIKFNSITFARGLLSVDGFEGTIKVSFKSVSIFDNIRQKMYDIDMKELTFGTAKPKTPTTADPGHWDLDWNDSSNTAGIYRTTNNRLQDEFVLAPVKVSGGEWRSVQSTIHLIEVTVITTYDRADLSADDLYLNFWNCKNEEFNIITANTRAFPFPYLKHVFDKVFSDTLADNPFSEGEMSKLVLICPYHPKYYQMPGYIYNEDFEGMLFDNASGKTASFTPSYKLNSFMPDIFANDFLKDILKIFCMSLLPYGDRFKVVPNRDIINNPEVENWGHKLIDKLFFKKRDKQVYKYGYSSVQDEFVEVREDNKVNAITDMYLRELKESDGYIGDFYIKSTGEYYTKGIDGDGVRYYNRKATGYGNPTETSGNEYDTVSNVAPLPMTIDDYWSELAPKQVGKPALGQWYVPEFIGDRMSRQTSAAIMFDRGKTRSLSGDYYPLLTATHKDALGFSVGDLSLAWEGEHGLINRFHKEFKEWVEKDKLGAYGEFNLSAVDLKMLDFTKKKSILGRNFYFEKIQVVFELQKIQPAQIDLIEA